MFAIFRWTKTSPGCKPVILVGRNAAIRTPDPEKLRRLLADEPLEVVRISLNACARPCTVAVKQTLDARHENYCALTRLVRASLGVRPQQSGPAGIDLESEFAACIGLGEPEQRERMVILGGQFIPFER